MDILQFKFTVDKVSKTIFITRDFAAEQSLVWDAFTTKELLDQWWAPKPFVSKTIAMNFEVGGRRFYAMVNPGGEEIGWQVQTYTSITPKSNFKFLNAFADKHETPFLPGSDWDLTFSEDSGVTTVDITIYNDSLERLEKMIEMGFREGFTSTLSGLAKLLDTWK